MAFNKIKESILTKPYHCAILVHPTIKKLEQVASEILSTNSFPVIDIGKELSKKLMDVNRGEYNRAINQWFKHKIDDLSIEPIVCNNISLLFEPSFSLDPLSFFNQFGKIKKLVILWPGDFDSVTLTYATSTHKHYRAWRLNDKNIEIFRLED